MSQCHAKSGRYTITNDNKGEAKGDKAGQNLPLLVHHTAQVSLLLSFLSLLILNFPGKSQAHFRHLDSGRDAGGYFTSGASSNSAEKRL